VIWTDTFQIVVMFSGMLAVTIVGTMKIGLKTIWKDATDSGRLDMLE